MSTNERTSEVSDKGEVAALTVDLARAEAELAATQALLRCAFERAWGLGMVHGEPVTPDEIAKVRSEFESWLRDNRRVSGVPSG